MISLFWDFRDYLCVKLYLWEWYFLGLQATVPIIAGEHRHLPLDMPTLPQQLKSLGYSTHLVGKWHVGASLDEVTPLGRGFDTHFGYWNGYIGYFDHSAVGLNDLKTVTINRVNVQNVPKFEVCQMV